MKIANKIKNFINRRVLRTPGCEFFVKNKDLNSRKKYLSFWLNTAKKNIKLFYGKPIISYPIEMAIKSNLFAKIMDKEKKEFFMVAQVL